MSKMSCTVYFVSSKKKSDPPGTPDEWRFVHDLQKVNQSVLPREPSVPNTNTILSQIPWAIATHFSVVDLSNTFFLFQWTLKVSTGLPSSSMENHSCLLDFARAFAKPQQSTTQSWENPYKVLFWPLAQSWFFMWRTFFYVVHQRNNANRTHSNCWDIYVKTTTKFQSENCNLYNRSLS